ncbi:MAG: threonylcarbamoyl-AMP synthase [Chloroflexi bacterium]|uniref:L-threonylcarbamoyladenylate synthase n=1 Tax=marine metagenome TaxID=408172 RepID=A0A382NJE8_9ZZZZ|nr:threonylcarbamoyl-AMP synthase [Chloroflexota bacterium]
MKTKKNKKILIAETISDLLDEKVCIIPTDTYFALSVIADSEHAISKLFSIKKRDADKPIPLLISSLNNIENFCNIHNEILNKLSNYFWPGPLTIVLPLTGTLPNSLNNNSGFIGVRVPNHMFTLELIKKLNKPLTGTSANISGFPPSKDINVIKTLFQNDVERIIDIKCGAEELSSTVIKIDNNEELTVLREGPISADDIFKVINK